MDQNEKLPFAYINIQDNNRGIYTIPYGYGYGAITEDRYTFRRKGRNLQASGNESGLENGRRRRSGLCRLFRFATRCDVVLLSTGIVFSVIHGAGFPVLALVFGRMTDNFIQYATQPNITSEEKTTFTTYLADYSLNYLYIGLIVLVASFIQTLCWELSCERQVHRLRQIAFAQIIRQDQHWYETRHQANLANMLSDDVERIREGIGCKFSMVMQYLSTFVCGTLVGLAVNWRLTAALLLVAPVLIGATGFLAKLTAGSAAREQLKYGVAGSVAEQVLSGIRMVAAFGTQKYEVNQYERALEVGFRLAMKKYSVLAWGLTLVFFLMYSQYGLAFYYGAYLINEDICTPGSVFTVFFSVLSGAFTLGNALPYVNSVATAFGAATGVFRVCDRTPPIDPYSDAGIRPTSVQGHISFQDVYFSYPSRPDVQVLKGLNLEILPGQSVALVGPSGSGKSTVINLLLRFYDPTQGTVRLDGELLRELNVGWVRQNVGTVSQEPRMFGMSIADNIRHGRADVPSQDEIEMAATQANVHAFIDDLPMGYSTQVGERGAQLSGGQKQRIAIARALVRDPRILLLDEATSALDTQSETVVQEALQRAMLGRTTVTVAHRLTTIRQADVIFTLDEGRVVERGTHKQLMAAGKLYYHLVNTQAAYTDSTSNAPDWEIPETTGVHYALYPPNWMSVFQDYTTPAPRLSLMCEDRMERVRTCVGPRRPSSDYRGESSQAYQTSLPSHRKAHSQRLDNDVLGDELVRRRPRTHLDTSSMSLISKEARAPYLEGEGRTVSLCELVRLNKPECCCLLLGLLGSAMSGGIMPIFAYFYGEMFATFTMRGSQLMDAAVFWSLMFICLGVLAAIAIWLEVWSMTLAVERLVMRLRVMAFLNILRQPVGWFDLSDHSSGRLSSRLARDAPVIKGAAGLRLGQMLSCLVTLSASLTIAFVCGWQLALVLLIIVPLITASAYHQTLMVRRTQMRDTSLMDDAGRLASECVSNIKTVQALGIEKTFVHIYMEKLEIPYRESKKQAVIYSTIFGLSQAVIYGMYSVAFWFGAYLIETDVMSSTNVYRVFFALAFCASSVGTTAAYVQDYNRAKTAARQMFHLIDRQSEIDALSPTGSKPEIQGKVQFENVSFHYPSRPDVSILAGFCLTVERGQTLAVVGPSGCGKSTVIALLERFYLPNSGSIMVDGMDIRYMNVEHLRRHIGLVTQEPGLFNRSIRENISYGVNSNMAQVEEAARAANCHDFIAQLPQGYDTVVGEGGSQLSGGQKQRIAIARALIRNPRILLLDEATSALDTESEKVVQEALERARSGRTCIVIAHRLTTVQTADVVAVLDDGRVREQGSPKELMARRGLFYRLVMAQSPT